MEKFEKLRNLEKELDNAIFKKKLLIEETYCQRPICTKTLRIWIEIININNYKLLTIKSKLFGDTLTLEKRLNDLLDSFYVFENFNNENVEIKENNEVNDKIENATKEVYYDTIERYSYKNDNKAKQDNFKSDNTIKQVNDNKIKQFNNTNKLNSKFRKIFEWHAECDNKKIEGFNFLITKNVPFINCYFEFKNSIDQYRISPKLQSIIKKRVETKTKVIIDIWKYIMNNKLFDNDDRTIVNCDKNLKKCFSVDFFKINELDSILSCHLLKFETVCLVVPIIDGYKAVYDMKIDLDDLNEMPKLYSNPEINQLENKIEEIQETIKRVKDKINNLDLYSKDPHNFLLDWVLFRFKEIVPIGNIFDGDYKFFYDEDVQKSIYKLLRRLE
ncbi:SWI/SNF-related matrix-associated actin-dependent regulator of chromatin subfamily D member 1 [Dictyocoela muelleri]|nr:SWI/SNF-related matrix-associated actin-dependent regulator of chromatin subfamily D member 1 [Dictyocoela muelleri]